MKNRILFFLAFCMVHFTVSAQPDLSKINKKAKEAFDIASYKYESGDYPGAIASLKEAIKKDGNYVDAYMSLALIYKEMKNYELSISNYEKGFQLDTSIYTGRYKLDYSVALAGLGRFEDALTAINQLLARPNLDERRIKASEAKRKSYQFAVDFQEKHAADHYTFSPQNLGDGINSPDPEYFPTLPIEGDKMIFTRRVNGIDEDFYGSIKSGGKWGKAVRIDKVNTPLNEAAQSISQDGRWLVFDACTRRDGYGSCDLYISYMTDNGWSEALNLGGVVNSEQWDVQPCLSPDKRDLYFTSTRPGGLGGSDIYVTHLQANGRWSTPENLGPQVNTAGDEACPFIHADNQTLYFTSNGHVGYGDMDIFLVRKGADGKWGTPENLGYPINTIENEGSLFIAADGKTAYYASDRREGKGTIKQQAKVCLLQLNSLILLRNKLFQERRLMKQVII
jgi:tetratricopeptide (TPR) repeat protein